MAERGDAGWLCGHGEKFADFPGAQFNFTQPIAAVDELLTGTKAELAAKLFGDDLDVLVENSRL